MTDCPTPLPLAQTTAVTRLRQSAAWFFLVRGGGRVALALLLSSCGTMPWKAEAPLRSIAKRRAVPTSQRQEARMARPQVLGSQPVVDYGVYKRITPGMELSEVQSLLEQAGQRYEVVAEATAPGRERRDSSVEKFWRWTHPSGVYNIHVRLGLGAQSDSWVVQSKWLTYNPPG